jgi:AraC-like DNA-binding protein
MTSMTALVRAAGLSGYESLASELGLDVPLVLRHAGLSRQALRDPDSLIPYRAVMLLLEQSALESGRDDFGQQLSRRQSLGILGPLAVLMEHASSVGEALQLGSRYVFVHSPNIRFLLEPTPSDENVVDLRFAVEMPHPPPHPQTLELSLGVIVQILRLLGQGAIRPRSVRIPHERMAPLNTYQRTYGCRCVFEQAHAAVQVDKLALIRPLSSHNPMLRKLAQGFIDARYTDREQPFGDQVRGLIRQYLAAGLARQDAIAKILAVHPRTMQRRLADEGTTFEAVKDEIRRETMQHLMSRSSPPRLTQVAAILDYAEQSALTRSCRRWFGVAPSKLRGRGQRTSASPATFALHRRGDRATEGT